MSAAPVIDPRRLDLPAFVRAEGRLAGQWPLASMPRLVEGALPPEAGDAPASVDWSARGSCRAVPAGDAQMRLYLQASTTLRMVCQRCLQPMSVALDIAPTLRFVRDEQQAEALDEDSDDEDVLALTKTLDLHALIEDELILALPLVPRHERCPRPLPMSAGEDEVGQGRDAEHAFAALAALRRQGGVKPD